LIDCTAATNSDAGMDKRPEPDNYYFFNSKGYKFVVPCSAEQF